MVPDVPKAEKDVPSSRSVPKRRSVPMFPVPNWNPIDAVGLFPMGKCVFPMGILIFFIIDKETTDLSPLFFFLMPHPRSSIRKESSGVK
jgi:hypothetical protein